VAGGAKQAGAVEPPEWRVDESPRRRDERVRQPGEATEVKVTRTGIRSQPGTNGQRRLAGAAGIGSTAC